MTGDTTPISDEAVAERARANWDHSRPPRLWAVNPVKDTWLTAARVELMTERDRAAAPLLVSAEAERPSEAEQDLARYVLELEGSVEGLRAELAEAKDVHARLLVRLSQDALFKRATDAEARELAMIDELAAMTADRDRIANSANLALMAQINEHRANQRASLRAAGGQEKPVCPLTEAGIEHRPHHYLTPVPWDCPGLPAAPVGGQAEPSDTAKAKLAEFIWATSRADESTISATGADVIAAALIRAGLAAAMSGEHQDATEDAQ